MHRRRRQPLFADTPTMDATERLSLMRFINDGVTRRVGPYSEDYFGRRVPLCLPVLRRHRLRSFCRPPSPAACPIPTEPSLSPRRPALASQRSNGLRRSPREFSDPSDASLPPSPWKSLTSATPAPNRVVPSSLGSPVPSRSPSPPNVSARRPRPPGPPVASQACVVGRIEVSDSSAGFLVSGRDAPSTEVCAVAQNGKSSATTSNPLVSSEPNPQNSEFMSVDEGKSEEEELNEDAEDADVDSFFSLNSISPHMGHLAEYCRQLQIAINGDPDDYSCTPHPYRISADPKDSSEVISSNGDSWAGNERESKEPMESEEGVDGLEREEEEEGAVPPVLFAEAAPVLSPPSSSSMPEATPLPIAPSPPPPLPCSLSQDSVLPNLFTLKPEEQETLQSLVPVEIRSDPLFWDLYRHGQLEDYYQPDVSELRNELFPGAAPLGEDMRDVFPAPECLPSESLAGAPATAKTLESETDSLPLHFSLHDYYAMFPSAPPQSSLAQSEGFSAFPFPGPYGGPPGRLALNVRQGGVPFTPPPSALSRRPPDSPASLPPSKRSAVDASALPPPVSAVAPPVATPFSALGVSGHRASLVGDPRELMYTMPAFLTDHLSEDSVLCSGKESSCVDRSAGAAETLSVAGKTHLGPLADHAPSAPVAAGLTRSSSVPRVENESFSPRPPPETYSGIRIQKAMIHRVDGHTRRQMELNRYRQLRESGPDPTLRRKCLKYLGSQLRSLDDAPSPSFSSPFHRVRRSSFPASAGVVRVYNGDGNYVELSPEESRQLEWIRTPDGRVVYFQNSLSGKVAFDPDHGFVSIPEVTVSNYDRLPGAGPNGEDVLVLKGSLPAMDESASTVLLTQSGGRLLIGPRTSPLLFVPADRIMPLNVPASASSRVVVPHDLVGGSSAPTNSEPSSSGPIHFVTINLPESRTIRIPSFIPYFVRRRRGSDSDSPETSQAAPPERVEFDSEKYELVSVGEKCEVLVPIKDASLRSEILKCASQSPLSAKSARGSHRARVAGRRAHGHPRSKRPRRGGNHSPESVDAAGVGGADSASDSEPVAFSPLVQSFGGDGLSQEESDPSQSSSSTSSHRRGAPKSDLHTPLSSLSKPHNPIAYTDEASSEEPSSVNSSNPLAPVSVVPVSVSPNLGSVSRRLDPSRVRAPPRSEAELSTLPSDAVIRWSDSSGRTISCPKDLYERFRSQWKSSSGSDQEPLPDDLASMLSSSDNLDGYLTEETPEGLVYHLASESPVGCSPREESPAQSDGGRPESPPAIQDSSGLSSEGSEWSDDEADGDAQIDWSRSGGLRNRSKTSNRSHRRSPIAESAVGSQTPDFVEEPRDSLADSDEAQNSRFVFPSDPLGVSASEDQPPRTSESFESFLVGANSQMPSNNALVMPAIPSEPPSQSSRGRALLDMVKASEERKDSSNTSSTRRLSTGPTSKSPPRVRRASTLRIAEENKRAIEGVAVAVRGRVRGRGRRRSINSIDTVDSEGAVDSPPHGPPQIAGRRHDSVVSSKVFSSTLRDRLKEMADSDLQMNPRDFLFKSEETYHIGVPEYQYRGGAHVDRLLDDVYPVIVSNYIAKEALGISNYNQVRSHMRSAESSQDVQQQILSASICEAISNDRDWEGYFSRAKAYETIGDLYQSLFDLTVALTYAEKAEERVQSFVKRSEILDKMGEPDLALDDLQYIHKEFPTHYLPLKQLAIHYHFQGNREQSNRCFKEAIELDPVNDARLWKGILSEEQDPGSGIVHFRIILSKNPNNCEVIWRLGNSLVARNEIDSGSEEFSVFYDESLKKTTGIDPSTLAEILLQRARFRMMLGQSSAGIADCTESLRLNSQSAMGYYLRAVGYTMKGPGENLGLALQNLNTCLLINPHYWYAYELRGMIYETKNQWSIATKEYREALRRNSRMPWARVRSGRIYLKKLTSYTTSIQEVKEAMSIVNSLWFDPQIAHSYVILGMAQECLGRYSQSLRSSQSLARLYPLDVWAQFSIAYYLLKLKRPFQALDAFLTSAYLQRTEFSMIWKAKGYTVLRRYGDAIEVLRDAIQTNDCLLYNSMLALNEYRSQNREEGRNYLSKALVQSGREATKLESSLFLGSALVESGRPEEAIQLYEDLIHRGVIEASLLNQAGLAFFSLACREWEDAHRHHHTLSPGDLNSIFENSLQYFGEAIKRDSLFCDAFLNRAEVFVLMKCYSEAESDYMKALRLDPTCSRAVSNLCAARIRQGKNVRAIQTVTDFKYADPSHCYLQFNAGLAYQRVGEFGKAIEYYTMVLDRNDTFFSAHWNRGLAYTKLISEEHKCLSDFSFVHSHRPSGVSTLLYIYGHLMSLPFDTTNRLSLLSELDPLLDQYPSESYYLNLSLGWLSLTLYIRQSSMDRASMLHLVEGARARFEAACSMRSREVYGRLGLAILSLMDLPSVCPPSLSSLQSQPQPSAAAASSSSVDLFALSKLLPSNNLERVATVTMRSLVSSSLPPSQFSRLQEWFDGLQSLCARDGGSSDPRTLNNLSVCQWNRGARPLMRQSLEQALQLSPDYLPALFNLSLSLLFFDVPRSISLSRRVACRWGHRAEVLNNESVSLSLSGSLEEALSVQSAALSRDPQNPFLLATRSSILLSLDRIREARDDIQLAISQQPSNPVLYLISAHCHESLSSSLSDYAILLFLDPDAQVQ